MLKSFLLGLASFVMACHALAGDVRVALPGGGALVLPVPAGWKEARQPGAIPTLVLAPEAGQSFQVLVSPLVRRDGSTAPADDPEVLRRMVESASQRALAQSVETSLPVQEFREGKVQGSYFSATDRAPKPGEFKYLTQGTALIQGLPVTFTILSNAETKEAVEGTLQALKGARRE